MVAKCIFEDTLWNALFELTTMWLNHFTAKTVLSKTIEKKKMKSGECIAFVLRSNQISNWKREERLENLIVEMKWSSNFM